VDMFLSPLSRLSINISWASRVESRCQSNIAPTDAVLYRHDRCDPLTHSAFTRALLVLEATDVVFRALSPAGTRSTGYPGARARPPGP
jgi:hypothetical protein